MINPEYKSHWRPETDLGRRYPVKTVKQESVEPTTREAAIAYVASLALPEVVSDYAGYPEVQADLVATLAAQQYPELFRETVTLTLVEPRSVA